jgi:hypothetical protein
MPSYRRVLPFSSAMLIPKYWTTYSDTPMTKITKLIRTLNVALLIVSPVTSQCFPM